MLQVFFFVFSLACVLECADAFSRSKCGYGIKPSWVTRRVELQAVVDPAFLSLVAGSFAGAIGVGASYPLDSIKTKSQTLASSGEQTSLLGTVKLVLQKEGVAGFYQGVVGVMIGQALVKSVAFSSNAYALDWITSVAGADALPLVPSLPQLAAAAAFSGFVSSFVCNPVERIKVLMQAGNTDVYKNEFDCIQKVIAEDSWKGLLGRGLDATLVREIPGYGVYFVVYKLLMSNPVVAGLGAAAPLLGGALAGCASWLPVYPADVIKTAMQNTKGNKGVEVVKAAKGEQANQGGIEADVDTARVGFWATGARLRREQGWGVFYDGITPKLMRASLNHAVTFYVYELLMRSWLV
ncbi:mitochondrial carrier domain-containing protein [Ochromonadaceae sp. CCMP2298]|nr:mitochondrial carrier domain-containing protein [Ochromonadaceae sp. CCMP2298]|mmetsp:Transcript_34085/g.75122  ORF Transcript_34085/g.75122 Transcript_34085/m.75122 type:complete len:352 (+) Transcript_34085:78-1133(+)